MFSLIDKDDIVEDNKLYDYMKEHPSILISCFSAITIVISFIFNGVLYLNELKYFAFWGIDNNYINVISVNNLYFLVAACIFYLVNTLVQQILLDTYEKISTVISIIVYIKYQIKLETKKQNRNVTNSKKNYATPESVQEKSMTDINSLKQAKNDMCKYLFKIIRINIFVFGCVLFLSAFLFLWTTQVNMKIELILLLSLGNVIISTMLPCILIYVFRQRAKNKKIREHISKGQFEDGLLMNLINEVDTDFLLIKLSDIRTKSFFSKDAIRNILFNIIMLLIYILIAVYPIYQDMTVDKKTFNVVTEGSQQYVIMYKEDKAYYLKEAKIVDNNISINISKQRIIVSDDVSYETIEFENVKRIK